MPSKTQVSLTSPHAGTRLEPRSKVGPSAGLELRLPPNGGGSAIAPPRQCGRWSLRPQQARAWSDRRAASCLNGPLELAPVCFAHLGSGSHLGARRLRDPLLDRTVEQGSHDWFDIDVLDSRHKSHGSEFQEELPYRLVSIAARHERNT